VQFHPNEITLPEVPKFIAHNEIERKKFMENLCDSYPVVMPFIPTSALLQKLIVRAT
jgi:hypothetical protein